MIGCFSIVLNVMRTFIATMVLMLMTANVGAASFKTGGICYMESSSNTLTVMPNGTSGSGSGGIIGLSSGYAGDVVIPDTLTYGGVKYTVTAVDEGTFSFSTKLTSVSLPATVTELGSEPFASCGKLAAITVDPDNPAFQSIDGVLYDKRVTTIIACPGARTGTFVVPETVGTVATSAFYGCSKLTSITLPASVADIGDNAFRSCTQLQSVNIPDGITQIGDHCFYGCTSLLSTNIPEGVVSIGDNAFSNCRKLPALSLPSSLRTIGDNAFEYCSSFKELDIPEGVSSIGEFAMMRCSMMKRVSLPSSLRSLGVGAFRLCLALTSIELAEGNMSFAVENGMLLDFDKKSLVCCPAGLKGACVVPASVTDIEDYAFYYCKNLTSITLPDSLAAIRTAAFVYCTSLKTLIIPQKVVTVGASAFVSCTELRQIVCRADNPPVIPQEAFSTSTYQTAALYVPASAKSKYAEAEYWKKFMTSGIIGDVNKDGHVNVADIMVMVNQVLGHQVVEVDMGVGDVNYDDVLNVTDIMGVVRICLNDY